MRYIVHKLSVQLRLRLINRTKNRKTNDLIESGRRRGACAGACAGAGAGAGALAEDPAALFHDELGEHRLAVAAVAIDLQLGLFARRGLLNVGWSV